MINKICILSVGKIPAEYKPVENHYTKMVGNQIKIEEIIIKKNLSGPALMKLEEKAILEKIKSNAKAILLDVKGKMPDSYKFAEIIKDSPTPICFIIGGAFGVTAEVKKRADMIISLSNLTFTHIFAKIILLEQIYRAKTIIEGHPYHKV